MSVTPTRHFIDYGERLVWEPPAGTAEFYVWQKRTADGSAMRWRRVGGYSIANGAPVFVPEGDFPVPTPSLDVDWAGLLQLFDGWDNEVAQVTAHGADGRLISADTYRLPAPTSTNAAAIAAQERRVLKDLLQMRQGLATMHGGHIKVRTPDGTEVERMPIAVVDRRIAEIRARIAWFEAADAGDVMPGLETW